MNTALPESVASLFERFGPMVLRRCRSLLRDEDKAADALQEVFYRLCRDQGKLSWQHPSSLLYAMATHVCIDRLRAEGVRRGDGESALETIAAKEDMESRFEASRLLDRLFRRHPPSSRVLAVMHFVDGFTLEEVAREVGLSVSGVRKRLRQLRSGLHQLASANPGKRIMEEKHE